MNKQQSPLSADEQMYRSLGHAAEQGTPGFFDTFIAESLDKSKRSKPVTASEEQMQAIVSASGQRFASACQTGDQVQTVRQTGPVLQNLLELMLTDASPSQIQFEMHRLTTANFRKANKVQITAIATDPGIRSGLVSRLDLTGSCAVGAHSLRKKGIKIGYVYEQIACGNDCSYNRLGTCGRLGAKLIRRPSDIPLSERLMVISRLQDRGLIDEDKLKECEAMERQTPLSGILCAMGKTTRTSAGDKVKADPMAEIRTATDETRRVIAVRHALDSVDMIDIIRTITASYGTDAARRVMAAAIAGKERIDSKFLTACAEVDYGIKLPSVVVRSDKCLKCKHAQDIMCAHHSVVLVSPEQTTTASGLGTTYDELASIYGSANFYGGALMDTSPLPRNKALPKIDGVDLNGGMDLTAFWDGSSSRPVTDKSGDDPGIDLNKFY